MNRVAYSDGLEAAFETAGSSWDAACWGCRAREVEGGAVADNSKEKGVGSKWYVVYGRKP